MKLLYTLLLLTGLAAGANAAVLTVNNNIPSPGQYSTITAAVAAAAPGDTLYISGSPYNYNSVTITKRLTLIGTGHSPLTQSSAVSKLNDINFSGTNTDLYDCNFIGLDFNELNYNVSNTRRGFVSRCKIRGDIYLNSNVDSLLIEGNYFANSGYDLYGTNGGNSYSNITVRNNVFNGQFYFISPGGGSLAGSNFYVDNNLFLYPGYVFYGNNYYLQFRNNIFYRADPNSGVQYSSFSNNLVYIPSGTTSFPGGTNSSTSNVTNADPLFVNFPAAGDYYDYSYDFHLQSASPAKGTGLGGTDMGIYGGDGFFQPRGIPNIPQINQFSITSPANATIAPGGTLQISVMSTIGR